MKKNRGPSKARVGTEKASYQNIEVSPDSNENFFYLKEILGDSMDVKILYFRDRPVPFIVCFIEGLVNKSQIDLSILEPVHRWQQTSPEIEAPEFMEQIEVSSLVHEFKTFGPLINGILKGQVAIFVNSLTIGYAVPLEHFPLRAIDEPESQTTVRGPREGFVESLQINTTLLRRRISNPALRFHMVQIGSLTNTSVLIAYMHNLADQEVLNDLMNRLSTMTTDSVFEGGMIEEMLNENRYSPFPTFHSSERPDVVASSLTEGKIAILVEGSPFVLLTPITFVSFFQAAEDIYNQYDLSSAIRIVRVLAFLISFSLPALYIAVTTFHQELVPTQLLVSLAAQREGVPFPAFIETLIMEVIFEILREAGIRMPRPIGSAVSIVGAIVIGESAVAAGLVSPAIVIVVSLTAISSFVSPFYAFSGAARILRFVLMVIATTTGIFGMIMFYILLLTHLCSLKSMGKPYFTSPKPLTGDANDTMLRLPFWWKNTKLYKKIKR
ncbi:GerA spore germination protein [Fictibacillus macauensis ZFHKF-1]|uniref:GerA spore germination protein n=1 Tax=Fictibacillus macauensis ZFHKF-1 TaxID=1196324 RepID=I8AKF7_9BACL|nr:spore germination protein [Fictibacillus macauensis]EIT86332.1 GerA spore germination protein [Fictibacillus macauensis ZFHKF-1]